MLPWMRVPNAKSTVAEVLDPRPRVDEESDLVLDEQRMRGVERQLVGLARGPLRLAPEQQLERVEVLGDVAQVRVADVVRHDEIAHAP